TTRSGLTQMRHSGALVAAATLARMDDPAVRNRAVVWDLVARVLDSIEAAPDLFVAGVEDRILARIEAVDPELSALFEQALRRGVRAAVRDALARLRSRAELPHELPPGLLELARLQAGSQRDPREFPDAWLVGQEVLWNRFALIA